jgi:hypothetical protein
VFIRVHSWLKYLRRFAEHACRNCFKDIGFARKRKFAVACALASLRGLDTQEAHHHLVAEKAGVGSCIRRDASLSNWFF